MSLDLLALPGSLVPHVRLLEVSHVAHRLGFSVEHVREMLRAGELPGMLMGRTGKRWRVDPRDLEAYVEACRKRAREVLEQDIAQRERDLDTRFTQLKGPR
jgi:excisionase family DNA binding protein